jgi:uncharacterized cupin superfamily protein
VARLNLFTVATTRDEEDPEGFRSGMARLGPLLEAQKLGGTVYDLPPGQAICPYHYEYGTEEWLIVLTGTPTLRTPAGEEVLAPGDVVCFPEGPEGAHKVTAPADSPARVLMLSNANQVEVSVYPDSDKIGAFPPDSRDRILVRRESGVDYFDREV